MPDISDGIGQPVTRSPRKPTVPRSWPHGTLCRFNYDGTPTPGTYCWCSCTMCWNKYARRCICKHCPCREERDRLMLEYAHIPGPLPPRTPPPRSRASQTQASPHSTPKTRSRPRTR